MKHQPVGPHPSSRTPALETSPRRSVALRAASAAAALALLTLTACTGGGTDPASSGGSPQPTPATGKDDELTAVDADRISGLKEETSTEDIDGGVDVELAYPRIPKAGPFADRLAEVSEQGAQDFAEAAAGAKSYTVDWEVSVAGGNVMAVRLTQHEKDGDGERTGYSTYWYNTESGHTAYSSELLAGQQELEKLDSLVKKQLKDGDADTTKLHPIAKLYDSIGFNPDGDLVVEFNEGQIAPAKAGRIHAVVPKKDADPLLSPFGKRAQSAAVVVTPKFSIDKAAAPKGGPAEGSVPGMFATGTDGEKVDCRAADSKCIALTFDDGPGPRTPELLDALAEHDAKATFFVTGTPVREYPETVRREYAEGHELGNHTVHHPDLTSLSDDGTLEELTTVNGLVRRETGLSMDVMRPPYGATNNAVAKVTEELGQAQILWSIDTNDWRDHDPEVVSDRAVERAKPGSIVLMHDIHSSTIDAVPDILERLTEKGYTMVTVSQLLSETEPGEEYIDGYPPEPSPSPSTEKSD
ncbi:hypothetical protein GCM10027570_26010 [Streptomonospora sediminis]